MRLKITIFQTLMLSFTINISSYEINYTQNDSSLYMYYKPIEIENEN